MPPGVLEILLSFLNVGQLTPAAFLDGFLLIVVASIVGVLPEYKDQLNEKLTESVEKLSRQNKELGQRETALRESEARFRVLAETTSSIIVIILLRESQERVCSMALIHEQLYRAGDFSHLDFGEYAESLTSNLLRSNTAGGTVKLNIDVREILIGIDLAIPCGLIINELVSNSLKYAFPGGRTGTIAVAMCRDGSDYVLSVSDGGVGMPRHIDCRDAGTFGLQLVDTLVGQLEGSIRLAGDGGTAYTSRFMDRK